MEYCAPCWAEATRGAEEAFSDMKASNVQASRRNVIACHRPA